MVVHWTMMFSVPLIVTLMTTVAITEARSSFTPINKWHPFGCTPEHVKANSHYYCDKNGNIRCFPGWSVPKSLCSVPICHIDNRTCVNGNCSKPFVCDCDIGWTGQFCEKCIRLPGCLHGNCSKPFECACEDGYEGMFCDKPKCDNCVNGDCVMPGMCACHSGWFGVNCTECQARDDCVHGRCVNRPFECECYSGFKGKACEVPVCKVGCNSTGGFCQNPETCLCKPGYEGESCDKCIKSSKCVNGFCNKPWECICNKGFFGPRCNDTRNQDGNWGKWGKWSDCSKSCDGGTRKRMRKCNYPRPQGNGTYCSEDGSSCEEIENCNEGIVCQNHGDKKYVVNVE